jgi:hypothetical protein
VRVWTGIALFLATFTASATTVTAYSAATQEPSRFCPMGDTGALSGPGPTHVYDNCDAYWAHEKDVARKRVAMAAAAAGVSATAFVLWSSRLRRRGRGSEAPASAALA